METEYKPGEEAPKSGIYQVVHDPAHYQEHEVTAVYDEQFPPCNHRGHHPRFIPVRAAHHLATHKEFS